MCANKNEKPYAHISINIILHASNKANDTEKQTHSKRFLGKRNDFISLGIYTPRKVHNDRIEQRDKGRKKTMRQKQESFTCK